MSKVFNDAWMSSYGFLRSRLDGSLEQATVGDVLRGKSGALPDLVHTHPQETVRDAIGILREYGVSQMPVVGAEPPVMAGEVAGSVSERELLSAVFEGRAKLADAVSQHMLPPLPLIGAGEMVSHAAKALRDCDAVMVVEEGKPVGVLTRHDLLGFLSDGTTRR
jgi:cystathionine beta-synthase